MSKQEQQHVSEHEVVELLLPWFVNGTLDGAESERVAAHIDRCTECQESLGVLRSMRAVVQSDSAIPMVPAPDSSALMARIGQEETPPRSNAWWGVALAASIVALVLGGFWFFAPGDVETAKQYELATGEDLAPMEYVFAIEFEAGLPEADRVGAFDGFADVEFGSEIAPNTYRVMVRLPASSLEDLEQFSEDAANRDHVRSVEILALQLPIR